MEYTKLNIPNVLQPQKSNLCWAASLMMLENYHNKATGLNFSSFPDEVNAIPYADYSYSISNSLYYERSFSIIKQNIQLGRPLVFELEAVPNHFNLRHYVLVYGYLETQGAKYLFINDPLSSFAFGTLAEYNLLVSGSTARIRQFHYDIYKFNYDYSPPIKTSYVNDNWFKIIERPFLRRDDLVDSVDRFFRFPDLVEKLMDILGAAFQEVEKFSISDLGSVITVNYNRNPIFMIEIYFDQQNYIIEKIFPAFVTRRAGKEALFNKGIHSFERLPGFGQYKIVRKINF